MWVNNVGQDLQLRNYSNIAQDCCVLGPAKLYAGEASARGRSLEMSMITKLPLVKQLSQEDLLLVVADEPRQPVLQPCNLGLFCNKEHQVCMASVFWNATNFNQCLPHSLADCFWWMHVYTEHLTASKAFTPVTSLLNRQAYPSMLLAILSIKIVCKLGNSMHKNCE